MENYFQKYKINIELQKPSLIQKLTLIESNNRLLEDMKQSIDVLGIIIVLIVHIQ